MPVTTSLTRGDFVKISGLSAAAKYNGFIGKVTDVDKKTENRRITVQFPYYGSMLQKSIKPANLQKIENTETYPIRGCFSPESNIATDVAIRWVQIDNSAGSERKVSLILGMLADNADSRRLNRLELSPVTVEEMVFQSTTLPDAEIERYVHIGRDSFNTEQLPLEHIKLYIATAEAKIMEGRES